MENEINDSSVLIYKQIECINRYIITLNGQISHNTELLKWFKRLCKELTKLIVFITNYHKNIDKGKYYKETLLLYLQQLLTSLSLLINIFVKESEIEELLSESRCFCKKQMAYSLNGIKKTISKLPNAESLNGNFIKWMDSALEKLSEVDYLNKKQETKNIFYETKLLFEEVLSHAMSIAQVTLLDDYKKIRGSSQSVLEALESLANEINKESPNTAMLNLFIDTCTNKLCALECKVNIAVLKLSLKVFSEYTLPLEAIHSFCFNKLNKGKQEQLDNLIVDFDLHVDRILQIGLFAVSCSSCGNNCVKIRSCLASLEALETELVPAFTSVLTEASVSKIQLSLLLKDYWLSQAHVLQRLIYLIIDPFAFCEVIYEENKLLVDEISENVNVKFEINSNLFEKLIQQSKVLENFVKVVLTEEQEHNINEIKKAYSDFKCVLREVKIAFEILPNDKSSRIRIVKRCKILLSSIKSLWKCFSDENQSISSKEQSSINKSTTEQNSHSTPENVILDHIITRGKEILQERSILYKTTIKNTTFKVPQPSFGSENVVDQKTPLKMTQLPNLKLTHVRNKAFINASYRNKTYTELQMTDILNELNNLTNASLGVK